MTRVVVCCGVGGVGKTTTAAAFAVGLAQAGERVVVLTIDPARRLADALGLARLDNTPHPVSLDGLEVQGGGSLHALMLDRKATWDEVVRRFSPDPTTAERLLDNRYYRAMSTRLTGSHEYMANEKLYELVESGRWDVVVLDTPPTQHAIEFLRAPERVRNLFDSGVVQSIVRPGRGLLASATRRVGQLVARMAGQTVLDDIAEFFRLFSGLARGMRERSAAVGVLLVSEQTRFYLVTSASAPDRADTLAFLDVLRDRGMRFEGFLVNRTRVGAGPAADLTSDDLGAPPDGVSPDSWDAWTRALLAVVRHAEDLASHHRAALVSLSRTAGGAPAWAVPDQPGGVSDLAALAALARWLPPRAEPVDPER